MAEACQSGNVVDRDLETEFGSKKRKLSNEKKPPNVIEIELTRDNRYVVAATAEDKCVRVFSLSTEGALKQLSQRCLNYTCVEAL